MRLIDIEPNEQDTRDKNNEWFTPARYIEAAREVMGSIDVDPASCAQANETVKAAQIYTKETNGLAQEWHGNVWLNPPYITDNVASSYTTWTRKLVSEYEAGNTTQAVLLIPVHSERQWFQPLYRFAICYCDHQIMFIRPGQPAYHLYHGLCFVYLGDNTEAFEETFLQFGSVGQFKRRAATVTPLDLWTPTNVA